MDRIQGDVEGKLVLIVILLISTNALIQTDTCQAETLNSMCQNSNEVIVSKSALYGRTGTGCTSSDRGYRNCSVNALSVVDRSCSGKAKCDEIMVKDYNMPSFRCDIPPDLSRNLQFIFTCVTVLPYLPSLEQLPPINMIMNQPLTSPTNSSMACATETNPLTIKTNKGQVIQISVTNFEHRNAPTICDVNGAFGYVNDLYTATNPKVLICKGVREYVVLTSTGEAIQLVITESANFILSFQVIDADAPSCDASTQLPGNSGCVLLLDDGSAPCYRVSVDMNSAGLYWVWYLLIGLIVAAVIVVFIVAAIFLGRFIQNRKTGAKGKKNKQRKGDSKKTEINQSTTQTRHSHSANGAFEEINSDGVNNREIYNNSGETELYDDSGMIPIHSSYLTTEPIVSHSRDHLDDQGYLIMQDLSTKTNSADDLDYEGYLVPQKSENKGKDSPYYNVDLKVNKKESAGADESLYEGMAPEYVNQMENSDIDRKIYTQLKS